MFQATSLAFKLHFSIYVLFFPLCTSCKLVQTATLVLLTIVTSCCYPCFIQSISISSSDICYIIVTCIDSISVVLLVRFSMVCTTSLQNTKLLFALPQSVLSGLPVSNRDHSVNGGDFLDDGTLLIACGGMTNQGYPGKLMGGLPESPLCAAILQSKVRTITTPQKVGYKWIAGY